MSTTYKYTLQHIKLNLLKFMKKIKEKNMEPNFWIIVDRSDFKPLQKYKSSKKNNIDCTKDKNNQIKKIKTDLTKTNIRSIREISDFIINKKKEYYKNKRFSEIKIKFNNDIIQDFDNIKNYKKNKTKPLITIDIIIYPTDENTKIIFSKKKQLRINFYIDDLRNMIPKVKNIEVLMRLLADSDICKKSSFMEISYSDLSSINK